MDLINKILLPLIFIAGGLAAGYAYYYFIGCSNGCPLTSSPVTSVITGGLIGWLLHDSVGKKD
jgi:formate-dependent nitrite reductase membrane component NrfD